MLAGALLAAFLVFTKPRGFDTWPYHALELAGFGLIFVAALGRVWCAAFINGRKNRELCTGGPYALCRNPLYLFSFLGVVGIGMAAQSLLGTVAGAVVFLVYYHAVIAGEEARLRGLFGDAFDAWCAVTPRFFPRFRFGEPPVILAVDSRLFVRSLSEVVWFLFSIIFVEVIEFLKVSGHIPVLDVPF